MKNDVYRRAWESIAAQIVHPKTTGLELAMQQLGENEDTAGWSRSEFVSVWSAPPDIELIVVQNGGSSGGWQWTARGRNEPDACDGADRWGWVETATRDAAEHHALEWYLENDE